MKGLKTKPDTAAFRVLGFFSILLAAGILLVHTPAQLYRANAGEFTFSLAELLRRAVPALVVIPAVLAAPLLLPWPRFRRLWAVGWFAAAMVIWVSSNFLILDIGPLDGRLTQLSIPLGFTLMSVAVIAAVAAGAVLLARRFPRPATAAALALNVMLTGMSWAALKSGTKAPRPGYDAALRSFLRLSESRNALLILLDSFQSELFEEVIKENPSFRDKLDGFQFFPDTVGPSATTILALPAIHSGKVYDGKRSLATVYDQDVKNGSFLVALAKEGFETRVLNPSPGYWPEKAICTSEEIVIAGSRAAIQQEYLRLFDLSVFRAFPGPSKLLVFNGGRWRARNWVSTGRGDNRPYRGQKFLEVFGEGAYVSGQRPTAKFLHVFITHLPVELDENCRPLPKPAFPTARALLTQSRCAIKAVVGVLDELKQLGVYDNTTIVVLSDHGIPPGNADHLESARLGHANPLLLFKPRDKRGRLQVSDYPAHTSDTPAMICRDLNACPDFCPSSSGLDAPRTRKRVSQFYLWRQDLMTLGRIPGLKEFAITGNVRSIDSWSRLHRPSLRLGRPVTFGIDSEGAYCLDWGWSIPASWGAWSLGPWASLSFSVDEHARKRPIRMVAAVGSHVNARHRSLSVQVLANGTPVGQWKFSVENARGKRDVVLMPDVWSPEDGGVTIRFQIDKPAAPADVGTSNDPRPLGISIESLLLEQAGSVVVSNP